MSEGTIAQPPAIRFYFEDLPVGTVFDLGSETFTEEAIIAFAREFDPQYFHIDPQAATGSSFGGLIASGVHIFGVFTRMVVVTFMTEVANLGGAGVAEMRWIVPVRPGDTVTGRARDHVRRRT